MDDDHEICVWCKGWIYFNVTIKDEWTHAYGGAYCLDRNGSTATPLHTAQPTYHSKDDVL
jgi:hypothetical protein